MPSVLPQTHTSVSSLHCCQSLMQPKNSAAARDNIGRSIQRALAELILTHLFNLLKIHNMGERI
jgi:hypothetical protein